MYRTFIAALSNSKTLSEVCNVSHDVCDYYGFDHFAYSTKIPVSIITPRYLVIESSGDSTQTIADKEPTSSFIRQYVRTTTPIFWYKDNILPREEMASRALSEQAADRGLQDGLTVPIHSHHAGTAMMNYGTKKSDHLTTEKIEKSLPELFLLASYTHEAISKHVSFDDYTLNVSQVSNREKECLRWSTEGLTSAEIAKKMSITESTVSFHLQNAMRKLDASNRQQLVARAIMLGVI